MPPSAICAKFGSSTDLERLEKLLKRPIDLRQPNRCGGKKSGRMPVAKLALQGHWRSKTDRVTGIVSELLLVKGDRTKSAARVKRLMEARRSIMARG